MDGPPELSDQMIKTQIIGRSDISKTAEPCQAAAHTRSPMPDEYRGCGPGGQQDI